MPISLGDVPRIFISHSHEDDEFGLKLVEDLRQKLADNTAVWYDSAGGLYGGDEWWKKIQQELAARPVFIVILSPDAMASRWVDDEIRMAWEQKNSRQGTGKLIIPILYKPCDFPPAITTLQMIRFHERNYDTAFAELVAALRLPKDITKLDNPGATLVEEKLPIIKNAFQNYNMPVVIQESNNLARDASGAVSSAIYYMQGQALFAAGKGNIESAIVAFSSALAVESDSEQRSKLLGELAAMLASQGEWRQTLQYVNEALQLEPKNSSLRALKVRVRMHLRAIAFYGIYARIMLLVYVLIGSILTVLKFIAALPVLWLSSLQGWWLLHRGKRILFVYSLLAVVVIFSGVVGYRFLLVTPDVKVIRIGVDLPFSGEDQGNGELAACGVEYAINKAVVPGYKLELVARDDVQSHSSIAACAGIKSATAANSSCHEDNNILPDGCVGAQNMDLFAKDAQIAGIVGPFDSSIALAEMPIANKAGIALVSPSNTYPCLTKNTPENWCGVSFNRLPTLRPTGKVTYFRVVTTDDHQGPVGADYLYNTVHLRTAYVVDDNEVYGIGLANTFGQEWQRLGGKILGHVSEKDANNELGLIQKMTVAPDLIYFAGKDVTGGETFYRDMKLAKLLKNTTYAGGDGLINPPQFINIVQPVPNNPIYATFPGVDVDTQPSAQNFITNYERIYNPELYGKFTVPSYDAASIIIQAVNAVITAGVTPARNSTDYERGKLFQQAVIDAIQHISYEGVMGHQSFDANGDTTNKVISVYQVGFNNSMNPQLAWLYKKSVDVNNQN